MANGELFGCFRQGSDIDLVLENSFALRAEGPGRVGVEAERPVKSWPGLEAAGVGKGKRREPFLAFPVVEATECGDWLLLRGPGTGGGVAFREPRGKEGQIWGERNSTSSSVATLSMHLPS